MSNEHYEKYKDTIKRVSRRNYRKRIVLLNELSNAGNNFKKVIDYTTEGETIANSYYCSVMG